MEILLRKACQATEKNTKLKKMKTIKLVTIITKLTPIRTPCSAFSLIIRKLPASSGSKAYHKLSRKTWIRKLDHLT